MIKNYLLSACLLASSAAFAGITYPECFSENFRAAAEAGDAMPQGWVTYGNDARPSKVISDTFDGFEGGVPYFYYMQDGDNAFPMCVTSFEDDSEADQWLITSEITVDQQDEILSFTAGVFSGQMGAFGVETINYKVLVSDGGSEKGDFKAEPVCEGTVKGSLINPFVTTTVMAPLSGYKDKKVRLAFVVTGKNGGMVGFSNMAIGAYYITIENQTASVCADALNNQNATEVVRVNVSLRTPLACGKLNAVLEANGKTTEMSFEKDFNRATPTFQNVRFADAPVSFTDGQSQSYKVTLTPDYEGAPSTVIEGMIGVPVTTYLTNVVVEEGTATTCQFCPYGIGAFNYYHDNFPGTAETGKFIGIAVHGGQGFPDPMNEGISKTYATPLFNLSAASGYPFANFNRKQPGQSPNALNVLQALINRPSYNKVEIAKVECGDNPDWGDEVSVTLNVRNAYQVEDRSMAVAVVLIENDVEGYNKDYNQDNAFAKYDASFVSKNYGEWLAPYMADFLLGGSLAYASIPFDKIKYQHVARGIFPAFEGQEIQKTWQADVAQSSTITFKVPDSLDKWKNTEIVALLIDSETQEILASDILDAANYHAGVGQIVSENAAAIAKVNGSLVNTSDSNVSVELFSVDGQLISRANLAAGASLKVDYKGIVVVRTVADKATVARKYVF